MADQKTYKFKLLRGKHTDREGKYETDLPTSRRSLRTFKAPDVFESSKDLHAIFDQTNSTKFEPLAEDHPVPVANRLPKDSTPKGSKGKKDDPKSKNVKNPQPAENDNDQDFSEADRVKASQEEDAQEEGDDPAEESEGDADLSALEDMTVEQLKEFAEGEEIDLHGAKLKADIIKAIRAKS
jgi:hypothetical protein